MIRKVRSLAITINSQSGRVIRNAGRVFRGARVIAIVHRGDGLNGQNGNPLAEIVDREPGERAVDC